MDSNQKIVVVAQRVYEILKRMDERIDEIDSQIVNERAATLLMEKQTALLQLV